MMNIRCLILSVVLLSYAQTGWSADSKGDFIMGGVVGAITCPKFVASMEKARSFGINTIGYVTEIQGYIMYLLGFQTGYNLSTMDTYDIFGNDKEEYALLSWVENYCRQNSSEKFSRAVIELSFDRYPKRQKRSK